MKYTVKPTAQFRKDYRRALRHGADLGPLDEVIAALAEGETLPNGCRDRALSGEWAGHRECRVDRDRLLEQIHREDEMRNEYCLRYAGVPWALARHFQLSLDMSRYTVEETVGLIRSVLAKWEK